MEATSPEEVFLQAVNALAEGRLGAINLIGLAEDLSSFGRRDLAARLYDLGIRAGMPQELSHAVYFNLGMTLEALGDLSAARVALEQALEARPEFHPARLNLGLVLARAGDMAGGIQQWTQTIDLLAEVNPTNLRYKKLALCYLAYNLQEANRHAEAEQALSASLALDRHQQDVAQHWVSLRQQQCSWPVMSSAAAVERAELLRTLMPLSLLALSDDPLLHLASAWRFSRTFPPPGMPRLHASPRPPRQRLRIGYLSSDLRSHAVGYLVQEVFERHDRDQFEIFAYYTGPNPATGVDWVGARLRAAAEHWVELSGKDDHTAAEAIAADDIDILVDLNGHTRDARTAVAAARPAPVIVNWLGYPGTMGSGYHHYIIADDWIIPPAHEMYYSERVVRLPCYQPNDTRRAVADTPTRAEVGLPDDAVVYCCFNSEHKITRFTFERWMSILEQVPDSVLWLFETSDDSRRNLEAAARRHGLAPERLIFAPRRPNPVHLGRYPLADLFLDTAPYGAHTTGSDALWMGVPVLTLSGRSFVSRVCGSLVRAAGLPELVCATPGEYVERAVALGRDREELARLKQRLVAGRSTCTLFDMERHVRALEDLYRGMWDDFQNGRLPVPDLTNLDAYLEVGSEVDYDETDAMAADDLDARYRPGLERLARWRTLNTDNRLWPAR